MRPTFDEIVFELENNDEFITEFIDKDEYLYYIDFVNSNNKEHNSKLESTSPIKNTENHTEQSIKEKHIINANNHFHKRIEEKEKVDEFEIDLDQTNNSNSRNKNNDAVLKSNQKINENLNNTIELKTHSGSNKPDFNLIQQYISSNKSHELIHYINDNCNLEDSSLIFDKCLQMSPDLFSSLCKEGISIHNSVAFHKYAISLIFNPKTGNVSKENYDKARSYLEESIKFGFHLSYFSLARLLYSYYGDKVQAFKTAKEGSMKGEKCSMCLLGYFITKGIGTKKKSRREGVQMMLESGEKDIYKNFASEIAIYYSDLANESDDENKSLYEKNAFEWFEKAYLMEKTRASINNYGICFLKGIHVKKDFVKAQKIFNEGVEKNDPNSMYHLAYILEKIDSVKSLFYYKKAAELGNIDAHNRYLYLAMKK